MRPSLHLFSTLALWIGLPLALASCGGAGFEPASKIQGLRVLAVQKDPAYAPSNAANPDDNNVNLELLYWDGKAKDGAPRDIRFNFFRCVNPPGDLYYNCLTGLTPGGISDFPVLDAGAGGAAGIPDGPLDAAGDLPDGAMTPMPPEESGAARADSDHIIRKRVAIPPGIVHPKAPGITPYGLVYVLFTACAGRVGPVDPGSRNGLPIGCFDDSNPSLPLGPDDFVPGYSAIYVYDAIANANPAIDDFLFRDVSFKQSAQAADDDVPHVARCKESDRGKCPNLPIQASIARTSAEIDPEAKDANGNPLQEQLWVAYHSTDGDFTSAIRLVNDAARGWNEDNGTQFRAPTEPGPIRIWAVVHDNRGGVAWAEGKIIVD